MKLNYALGIKKIIILWIVVFLGGYILNSFFEKINSLDEGLNAISHNIPPGFKVEYWNTKTTGSADRTYQNDDKTNMLQSPDGIETPSKKKIRVSMVANNTPAPASAGVTNDINGCGGPTFGLTAAEMYPKSNRKKNPFIHGGSWSSNWFRKLSKSECQMFKRGIDCTSKPQDYVNKVYLGGKVNGYSKKDNGVLPVISNSQHGMGCMAVPASGNLRRVVWNTGCKPSSGRNGICTVGALSGYSGSGGAHTVLWSFPRRKDTGIGQAKGQGVWHPSLPSQVAKGNNPSNWDKYGIPIETGDGIPR